MHSYFSIYVNCYFSLSIVLWFRQVVCIDIHALEYCFCFVSEKTQNNSRECHCKTIPSMFQKWMFLDCFLLEIRYTLAICNIFFYQIQYLETKPNTLFLGQWYVNKKKAVDTEETFWRSCWSSVRDDKRYVAKGMIKSRILTWTYKTHSIIVAYLWLT